MCVNVETRIEHVGSVSEGTRTRQGRSVQGAWQWLRGGGLGAAALVAIAGLAHGQTPIYVLPGDGQSWWLGRALSAGDVDGDGVLDVIAGSGAGRVRVFSGKTGARLLDISPTPQSSWFGHSVASAGDVNGDGHDDIVVGDPGEYGPGKVYVFSGRDGSLLYQQTGADGSEERLGRSVAGGVDLDGDGVPDFVAGGYFFNGVVRAFSGADGEELWTVAGPVGYSVGMIRHAAGDHLGGVVTGLPNVGVHLLSGMDGSTIFRISSSTPGEDFGYAVARVGDLNGDGVEDFAVGAPYSSIGGISNGRVDVFSGTDGTLLLTVNGLYPFKTLGVSVAGAGDVDGDGVPDIIAGAPTGYNPTAHVFSGATGAMLYELTPPNPDQWTYPAFGWSVAGVGDLNQDGLADFAVAYMWDHTYGTYAGSIYVYLSGSSAPQVYCQAKLNSQYCVPEITSSGLFSLSVADNFHVHATKVINQQPGLLAWSTSPAATPFFGGTLCLENPIIRTPVQISGGSPSPPDCSGTYDFHFSHAYATQVGLQPGTTLYAQYWQRDPTHPDGSGIGLTDALSFTIYP